MAKRVRTVRRWSQFYRYCDRDYKADQAMVRFECDPKRLAERDRASLPSLPPFIKEGHRMNHDPRYGRLCPCDRCRSLTYVKGPDEPTIIGDAVAALAARWRLRTGR